jgi:valyl-tRNA synthetase
MDKVQKYNSVKVILFGCSVTWTRNFDTIDLSSLKAVKKIFAQNIKK